MDTNALLQQIGNTIKSSRLSKGISTDLLASTVRISRATLWSVEKGSGNVSISTYLALIQALDLKIRVDFDGIKSPAIKRSPKRITKQKIKRNQFEVFCVENYAQHTGISSNNVYSLFKAEGLLEELRSDYEDLHGMGTEYLMQFIDSYLNRGKI